jgi:uncharacterized damage-inducible protein DinB
MTIDDLRVLLDYHYWARDRLLEAVEVLTPDQFTRDMGNSFRSIRDTLVHIYFAEWVWHMRWQGTSPTGPPIDAETFHDVASIRSIWTEHERKMRSFLDALGPDGVNRVIDYRNLAGQEGSSVLWHMLQHVVNHASYHRGQVTTMLRQLGATPPKSMDLITFYREASPHVSP